ncbi:MAG TPA: DUF222 domain-containing protein, partial [Propionibacteriaceae bacterium]
MDHGGETVETLVASPVDHALDQFLTGIDHLVKVVEDGGLDHHDDAGLVDLMQRFERGRNRLSLIDHRIIRDGQARDLPGRLCQTSMVTVLAAALRISGAEASRRVRATEQVGDRVTMLGEPLAPVRPVLAAAQRAGEVTPDQVQVILAGLGKVD